MINEKAPLGINGNEKLKGTDEMAELTEDMEMVSPGAMLREARSALKLTQEHIATKLNFKLSLVNNLENDVFDEATPVTFNRGYLVNYAKLVDVDVEDILASYHALDAATIQRSEMLSFSKKTAKQAEHSRVIWLSYLIVAVLIGLTILWYMQESDQQTSASIATNTAEVDKKSIGKLDDKPSKPESSVVQEGEGNTQVDLSVNDSANSTAIEQPAAQINSTGTKKSSTNSSQDSAEQGNLDSSNAALDNGLTLSDAIVSEVKQSTEPAVSTAVFTFSGDCWVNIFDATGERIAWGVKKAGYVMTIKGVAPLKVTVGKPELTSIVFNETPVDMSLFNIGNIAKFNLPITE